MNIIAKFSLSIIFVCMSAALIAKESRRIDSSSESSFDRSFSKVVKKLNKSERRTFALGLFGVLLPKDCLSTEAIIVLTFSPVSPKDGPLFSPCREQLNGMSYQDVLDAAEPPDSSSEALPNKSLNTDASDAGAA